MASYKETMTDDELMALLRGLRSASTEARLSALSHGELTPEDFPDAARDPELARAVAMHTPPSAESTEAMVRAAMAQAPRPDRRRLLVRVAAPLAVAAALLFFITRGASVRGGEVPPYELVFTGSIQEHRAEPAPSAEVRLHRGSPFEMIARPAERLREPVTPYALLVEGGQVRAWSPPFEIDPGGSVRIAGDSRVLFPGGPGVYEVVLVLSRRPPLEGELEAIARGGPTKLRVVRGRVNLLE